MAGFANFIALLPAFVAEWQLTNTQAGWISGIYLAGYMGAVPVLVALTDRIDARRIYISCTLLSGLASLAFALFADGFWSALILRAAAGVGLAGTYMPGLKILTERVHGPRQSRALAFYTSCFSVGAAFSFLMTGEVAAGLGWQWTFGLASIGAVLSALLVAASVAPPPTQPTPPVATRLLDFRPVIANRRAMGFVIAYGAHAWELFGQRTWMVAFLTFSLTLGGAEPGWLLSATMVATLISLAGVPASIVGNELAMRLGRVKVAAAVGLASMVLSLLIGFSATLPYVAVVGLCILYGILNYGDSAAITAGAVMAATPGQTGATMAVHSCVGFGGGFLGAVLFGVVLDLAGGSDRVTAWGLAFASLGIAAAIGPLALFMLSRGSGDGAQPAGPRP